MSVPRLRPGTTGATIALIVLAAVAAWLLYPHPRREAAAQGVTEIVLWTPPGPLQDASRLVATEFERRNPAYRVVISSATSRDATGDPSRFLLSMAGDMPPDVILFDRFAIVEWASRGAFTDLQPFVEAQQADDPMAVRRENFFAPTWDEAVYRGGLYAIPRDADTRAMYYDRNALVRAGFVYEAGDPDVEAGRARPGEARPPKTWEELCTKRLHAVGTAEADGTVHLGDFLRRTAVNEDVAEGARPDALAAGVRPGDVAVLLKDGALFRARIAEVIDAQTLRLDLDAEQPPSLDSVPDSFASDAEIKVFDADGYVIRMTRFDAETGRLEAAGFIPLYGSSWFYLFGWQNGGEFMSADGTKCTIADPRIVGALQWLQDVYDAMGGSFEVTSVQTAQRASANQASGVTDPFLTGRVAMRIDADSFLRDIMNVKPGLDFGVAPAPLPRAQLDAGVEPFGWGGGWAYAMPSTAREKEGAWELIRWMASVEGNQVLAEYEASLARAQGRRYLPRLHADKRVLSWLEQRFLDNNPNVPASLAEAYSTFAELMPVSRYRPVTPVGQKLWSEHIRAASNGVDHLRTPPEALGNAQAQVQRALDAVLHPPEGPRVNWKIVIALYVLGVVALFAGLAMVQERRRRLHGGGRRTSWFEGYVCASPWLLGFIVFGAGPILFSFVISFCHYDVLNDARFVGLDNYINLLGTHLDPASGQRVANDPLFWISMRNTGFMILSVPLQIVIGLAIAVLLDAKVKGMTAYRTIYYLPAIVPAVAGFILWMWLFDPGQGFINQVLMEMGVRNPPRWLEDPAWSKPSLILMGLWGVGASMIIWLAGLKDIPESLHEAASVDGAGRIQRFFRITIPLLTPYILFNLIMGMIAIFQIFEAAYIMTDGGPSDSTLFYAYKLFNEAFRYLNMGTASAMAWILFAVVLTVTMVQLWSSKRWVHYGS
ncbi:MAG: multiple sugar transport system permease protein [Candidatus Sumerlaeota bacterium]|nr:multiple sugar transport system permease protein [Candidatus Sumerlaeota bacterium]